MRTPPPTETGDALILRTSASHSVYAVGAVVQTGQDDFRQEQSVRYVTTRTDAVRAAKVLSPHGRFYLLDIDTAVWSELDRDPASQPTPHDAATQQLTPSPISP